MAMSSSLWSELDRQYCFARFSSRDQNRSNHKIRNSSPIEYPAIKQFSGRGTKRFEVFFSQRFCAQLVVCTLDSRGSGCAAETSVKVYRGVSDCTKTKTFHRKYKKYKINLLFCVHIKFISKICPSTSLLYTATCDKILPVDSIFSDKFGSFFSLS